MSTDALIFILHFTYYMSVTEILFWFLSALALVSAIMVVD